MPLRQKKLLKVFITHENQDLKKAVLYMVEACLLPKRIEYILEGNLANLSV